MKQPSVFLAALAALIAAPALSEPPQLDLPLMQRMVERLSADELEGRAPSAATEPEVLDTIISEFKAAGLQPGKDGWLQPVPTLEITGQDYSTLDIEGTPLSFAYGSDYVAASYRESPRTDISDAELVFVGYGINAPELGWNDYAGVDMHGKIAVILVNDPDFEAADERGPFKGRRMTWYGRWPYKFEEAARQGARGALIVHDTFPAAYGWNVVESSWSGAQYYVQSANRGMDQTEANGWIQKPVAEKIFAASGQDFAALSAAAKQRGFEPVPLGLKANLSFANAIRKSMSHNVVGVLPGTTRPDEYVLYSAHWDHLGRCKPDASGDDICNGAVDNATGVAALVAIAKANVEAGRTPRSQVFLAVTLEESGLLGSEYYAQHPVYPLARTVGGVNMDALPVSGAARDYTMVGGDKSDLTGAFRATLSEMGLVESPEEHTERGSYYRSDHFSFAKRGVPMYSVDRGLDLIEGGKAAGEAASEDYVKQRYHGPNDEYSADWDWSGIAQDLALFYSLGRGLATSTAWPNWHPGDEFRSVRDASRAAAARK